MDFESDAALAGINDSDIQRLADMVLTMVLAEDRIARLSSELELEQADLRNISEVGLPALMDEFGLESMIMKDGSRLVIKKGIKASIPKVREPEAFGWLRERGHGSLIKNVVTAKFGMGEEAMAEMLVDYCMKNGLVHDRKESIPWNTLAAFVKEQIANAEDIPFDLFGVFETKVAKVTRPKL